MNFISEAGGSDPNALWGLSVLYSLRLLHGIEDLAIQKPISHPPLKDSI